MLKTPVTTTNSSGSWRRHFDQVNRSHSNLSDHRRQSLARVNRSWAEAGYLRNPSCNHRTDELRLGLHQVRKHSPQPAEAGSRSDYRQTKRPKMTGESK